jgi:hypothetical protein
MGVQVSDAAVQVNNNVVAIVPNSLVYDEGLGEQTIKAASAGGGQVEQIFSNNIESNFSMVRFDVYATVEMIALARQWKVAQNGNLVQIQGRTSEGNVSRSFTQAALLSNYEVALGSDTTITLEFKSNPAI